MRILVGAPVRQEPEVFRLYLESLGALDTSGLHVDRCFVLHNSPHLVELLGENDAYLLHSSPEPDVRDDRTHRWQDENIRQVTAMKNWLIQYALREGYDGLMLVDSDLVLHPKTLQVLVDAGKDIVAEVFWTAWEPGREPLPNAWHFDAYALIPEEAATWRQPGLYPAGMTGACILIRRHVLKVFWNVDGKPWVDTALTLEDGSTQVSPYVILDVPAA